MGYHAYITNTREKCSHAKKKEGRPTLRYILEDEGYYEEGTLILSEEYKKRAQKESEAINVEAVEKDERKRNALFKLISKLISRND